MVRNVTMNILRNKTKWRKIKNKNNTLWGDLLASFPELALPLLTKNLPSLQLDSTWTAPYWLGISHSNYLARIRVPIHYERPASGALLSHGTVCMYILTSVSNG